MEWISVDKELPKLHKNTEYNIKISDEVLVIYANEYYLAQFVDTGEYRLWEICGDGSKINPTHWAYLPTKPSNKNSISNKHVNQDNNFGSNYREHGEAVYIRNLINSHGYKKV